MKRISVIVVLLVLVVMSGIFGYRKTHSVKKTEGDTIVKENVKVITEERKTILEAIKWAQEHHNTVGDIIAGVADSMNARQQLMNQFGFCMEQAQAIIDMRLRMFCDKERKKISEEIDSLRAYFINYENVLW